MKLPLLVSVPHAGLWVPPEARPYCRLSPAERLEDGDVGAAEIYWGLERSMVAFATTDIARAIVDLNREEDDRRRDGVVKTHTCWDVPVYREPLPETVRNALLERYHRPYHARLSELGGSGARLGVDCHTMAAMGPPVGPDPGKVRPAACLSHADGTCPEEWIQMLQECLTRSLERDVRINDPFRGGHIIRNHASELPWIQLELSREAYLGNEEKAARVLAALEELCRRIGW